MLVGQRFEVTLRVKNEGRTVWLAEGDGLRGAVMLGARWFQGGTELPSLQRRLALKKNLFPGQSADLTMQLDPPARPRSYVLELGMALELGMGDEGMAWFVLAGVRPFSQNILVMETSKSHELR